jgi:hypothetical protein
MAKAGSGLIPSKAAEAAVVIAQASKSRLLARHLVSFNLGFSTAWNPNVAGANEKTATMKYTHLPIVYPSICIPCLKDLSFCLEIRCSISELQKLCCHRYQVRVRTTDIKDVFVNSFWRLCFMRVPVYDISAPTYEVPVTQNFALLLSSSSIPATTHDIL